MSRPRALSEKEELQIFEMYKDNQLLGEIARKFNISSRTVSRIVKKIKETQINRFENLLNQLVERDNTHERDIERKAMFCIIAGNEDLYKKVDFLYNFEDHEITPERIENREVDLCTSSKKLIGLAYNLFNGYDADVLDTFYSLDEDNFELALKALKLRFNRGQK